MNGSLLAATGGRALWYLTRGSGMVALVLLSLSVALGVLHTSRWERPAWPRFVTAGLHRNVSLLVVVFLAIHIVTAELDTFAPVGRLAVLMPFASAYRPVWLGLGTLAFDVVLALVVTSLLRGRIGHRTWRAVHWSAYGSWPIAVVHALGTGSDVRVGWAQLLGLACGLVVAAGVGWRIRHTVPGRRPLAGGVAVASVLAVAAWAILGPLRPGWAKRAGTPSTLLASASSSSASASSSSAASAPAAGPAWLPALPASGRLSGTLTQTGPDHAGLVTITISAQLSGGTSGAMHVVISGRPAGGGVSLASSSAEFGPVSDPAQYRGRVIALDGDQLVVSVASGSGASLDLGLSLQIDPASGAVHGQVRVQDGGP